MKVRFDDFKIVPVMDSIRKEEIDDATYFSKPYAKYISNSRLKYIDPSEGGSWEEFCNPSHISTSSLNIGSAVHEVLLQPESFELAPKMGKPSAKLGAVIDEVYKLRQDGYSIYDAIKAASNNVDYFKNTIDKKIPSVIEKGLEYYKKLHEPRWVCSEKEQIMLCDKDWDIVNACLESCYNNKQIMNYLHPTDIWGDPIESYCEDALFMDFLVVYKGKKCETLPFKLKIDNWTIDPENKIVTLNDLKTTGKSVEKFMHPEWGSFAHYHYFRQMYVYGLVLWYYCQQKYGVSKQAGWKMDFNILAVQTLPDYTSQRFNISRDWLKKGQIEFEMLMKRVAAYRMFGEKGPIDFA